MQLCSQKRAYEGLLVCAYSPDGRHLVTGSNDNHIDLFSVPDGYAHLRRCAGHSSYITGIDWSADSSLFQSTCGAYELLYWDAASGRQAKANQRDTRFASWTCTLGFPVMGIFPDFSDGTDVDSACRSYTARDPARLAAPSLADPLDGADGRYVVTGDDFGGVRLYAYPCVIEDAPSRSYVAHSSHVKQVAFAADNR